MKQIRKGVFETNSSSCHSISISEVTDEFFLDTSLLADQDGVIELRGGEFGWEFQKYNDALTKANYCLVDSLHDEDKLEMLREVIADQTAADEVRFLATDGQYGDPNYSYIDHESYGITSDVFTSKEELRDFIFNKNRWLFTANDNETPDPTFYDVPKYAANMVINPVYTHELKVEGYDKTTKFKSEPTKEEIYRGLRTILEGVKCYGPGKFDDDNSVMAQLHRNRDSYFEFDYRSEITDTTVEFLKEIDYEASRIYKIRFPNDDYLKDKGYEKVKEIEKELKEENPEKYSILINYFITEIKK